jgi:hypothetical protein
MTEKFEKLSSVGIFMDGGLTQQAQIFCSLSIILSQGSNKALENRLQIWISLSTDESPKEVLMNCH